MHSSRAYCLAIFIICNGWALSAVAAPLLPTYDADAIQQYLAHPSSIENDHERAFRVVEAYSTKLYADMMTYYMREMRISEAPVPIEVLDSYVKFCKTMPTPILVLNAKYDPARSFDFILLANILKYQVTHKKPISMGLPPTFGIPEMVGLASGNSPPPQTSTHETTPKKEADGSKTSPPTIEAAPITKSADPEAIKRIARLEAQLKDLENESRNSKRNEKILFGIFTTILLLGAFIKLRPAAGHSTY